MFEVPDSDITAVHIEEGAVLGQGSIHYSRSSRSNDELAVATNSSSNGQLSQDRESMPRTGDSVAV